MASSSEAVILNVGEERSMAEMGMAFRSLATPILLLVLDISVMAIAMRGFVMAGYQDYSPWQMGIHNIQNTALVKDNIAKYSENSITASTTDLVIQQRVLSLGAKMKYKGLPVLVKDPAPTPPQPENDGPAGNLTNTSLLMAQMGANGTSATHTSTAVATTPAPPSDGFMLYGPEMPVWLQCVKAVSTEMRDKLGDDDEPDYTAEEVQDAVEEGVWWCTRLHPTSMLVSTQATLDALLVLLLWTAHAVTVRVFEFYCSPVWESKERKGVPMLIFLAIGFSLSVGVWIWSIIVVAGRDKTDLATGILGLMGTGFGFLMLCASVVANGRAVYINEIDKIGRKYYSREKGADGALHFNPTWVIVCLVKPLVVGPAFVLVVFTFLGISELWAVSTSCVLSTALVLMGATLAYYNLYITHKKEKGGLEGLSRHPLNTLILIVLCALTIAFVPWPRRIDVRALWDPAFGTFVLAVGLLLMVAPDVAFQFNNANSVREMSECIFRVVLVFSVVYQIKNAW